MYAFFISVVSIVFVLGVLVFFHELGHFLVAKLFKVRVEVFSLGFGTRLWGFRRGETDYRISALPLGGYVKMAGENPMEENTGAPDEFSSHPRWQRFLIAIAGPAMNIILSIVVLTGVYMWQHEGEAYLSSAPVIGYVQKDTPANKAGLQMDDKIVRVEGHDVAAWQDVLAQLHLDSGQTVHITFNRAGKQNEAALTLPAFDQDTDAKDVFTGIGFYPDELIFVMQVSPATPADRAGLQSGDQIEKIDDIAPRSMQAVVDYLQQVKGAPVHIEVRRGNEIKTLTASAAMNDGKYRLGFAGGWVKDEKLPFAQAFAASMKENKQDSLLIVQFLGKIAQHPKTSLNNTSSVVMMAKYTGEAARQGWMPLFGMMAIISINLGIFNLLPIPILDGGVILLLFVEGIMRRDLNRQLKERIYAAAFVFLVAFAVLVIFKDILSLTIVHKT